MSLAPDSEQRTADEALVIGEIAFHERRIHQLSAEFEEVGRDLDDMRALLNVIEEGQKIEKLQDEVEGLREELAAMPDGPEKANKAQRLEQKEASLGEIIQEREALAERVRQKQIEYESKERELAEERRDLSNVESDITMLEENHVEFDERPSLL